MGNNNNNNINSNIQPQNFGGIGGNNYNFGNPAGNNIVGGALGKLPSGIPSSGRQDSSNKYKFGDAKKPGLVGVANRNRNAMNILGNNMIPNSGGDRINSGNNLGGIAGSGINSGNKNSNNNVGYKFGNMGIGNVGMPQGNNIGMGRYKF